MKRPGDQAAPAYSEAQSTAWLAWLARGMRQNGQTVFLIEGLQPGWLSTRTQRWIYFLATRLLWGMVIGLILGLIFGRTNWLLIGRTNWLILGLILGLIFGLILGLIDVLRTGRAKSQPEPTAALGIRRIIWSTVLCALILWLIFGLISWVGFNLILWVGFGLDDWVGFGLTDGLTLGVIFGLITGPIGGPFWALRSLGRQLQNEIQPVEFVGFSPGYFPSGFKNGLFLGLVVGLIGWLIIGLIGGGLIGWLSGWLINGLIWGLIGGLIGGLLSCFRPGIRDLKTIPNQGIWLSVRTGCLMGGVGGLALGLIMGLIYGPAMGLVYGMLGGLCIGLWFGGLDVIQHYIVRILLWRAGATPRDYARFLDYAAEELNFLQKVGGGYMFVHRYLLEYFAAMAEPQAEEAGDGKDVDERAMRTV